MINFSCGFQIGWDSKKNNFWWSKGHIKFAKGGLKIDLQSLLFSIVNVLIKSMERKLLLILSSFYLNIWTASAEHFFTVKPSLFLANFREKLRLFLTCELQEVLFFLFAGNKLIFDNDSFQYDSPDLMAFSSRPWWGQPVVHWAHIHCRSKWFSCHFSALYVFRNCNNVLKNKQIRC